RGDGVGRVLLLDVREHVHRFRADRLAVAQQLARVRLDQALVRDVREHEALDAHEARAASERHGQRLAVGARQHLHAQRQLHRAPHLAADRGHRRDDLRSGAALQVGAVVHVLESQRMEARARVEASLGDGPLGDRVDAPARGGGARERANMDDAREHPWHPEERAEDPGAVQSGGILFVPDPAVLTDVAPFPRASRSPLAACLLLATLGVIAHGLFSRESGPRMEQASSNVRFAERPSLKRALDHYPRLWPPLCPLLLRAWMRSGLAGLRFNELLFLATLPLLWLACRAVAPDVRSEERRVG